MGADMSVEVAKQYEVYANPEVATYIQTLGDRVARSSDRPDMKYHFAVIKKDELNAFAVPGGYIYVYTGLMKKLDDEAQLAGVIAHEVAHVTARHSTERLSKLYGAQFILSLLLGDNPNAYAKFIAETVTSLKFLQYSREDEYEADRLGTIYQKGAGYDPNGMTEVMKKLTDTEAGQPTALEVYLSTHPPTAERFARLETQINALSKAASPMRNKTAYEKIKAKLP